MTSLKAYDWSGHGGSASLNSVKTAECHPLPLFMAVSVIVVPNM